MQTLDDIIIFLKANDYHTSYGSNTLTFFSSKHFKRISHTQIIYLTPRLKMKYTNKVNNQVEFKTLDSTDFELVYDAVSKFVRFAEIEDTMQMFMLPE
jgi:hypothetical protein